MMYVQSIFYREGLESAGGYLLPYLANRGYLSRSLISGILRWLVMFGEESNRCVPRPYENGSKRWSAETV